LLIDSTPFKEGAKPVNRGKIGPPGAALGFFVVFFLFVFALGASLAESATIELAYASLERILVRNVMTEGGRYYLQGDLSTPCQYAFIQEPRVGASAGRLQITVLFSGKAAADLDGRCVGAGDNFDVQVSGAPRFANGEIYLDGLEVQASSTYFNVVAALLRKSLEEKFRFSVAQAVEYVASQSAASGIGRLSVEGARVDDIQVGETALKMTVDFAASLRP